MAREDACHGRAAGTALVAEVALVRAQLAAVEPRADPLGAGRARGVRPLADPRQRPRGAPRRAPRDRGRHAARAERLDHGARARAGADRRGDVPQHRRHGRRDGPRRDRQPLHARQRLLRHGRQSPLRRPRPAGHVAGLHVEGPDAHRRQRLVRRERRRDERRDERRPLRDRRQQCRHDRHPGRLDRGRRAGQGAADDRVRPGLPFPAFAATLRSLADTRTTVGASRAMKIVRHTPNLVRLTRLGAVNAFLVVEDDGLTLVDTLLPGSQDTILAAAREVGQPIARIALTHARGDHIGSLDALAAALPTATVAISERDARFLTGDKTLDPGEPQSKLRGGYPKVETRPGVLLNPGDRVGSLEVVAAPGHTPGQVAFLDTRDRTLIAGDAYSTLGGVATTAKVNPRFPLPGLATWDKPTAVRTARELRALDPARLAVGHGNVVESPAQARDAAIARAEGR